MNAASDRRPGQVECEGAAGASVLDVIDRNLVNPERVKHHLAANHMLAGHNTSSSIANVSSFDHAFFNSGIGERINNRFSDQVLDSFVEEFPEFGYPYTEYCDISHLLSLYYLSD